jgi:hypothetical protein
VVGGDALGVAQQLCDFGQRAGALVVQVPATTTQAVRTEVRRPGRLARLRDRSSEPADDARAG